MKKLSNVLIITLGFAFLLSLVNPVSVSAATAPDLGVASGYSVYGHSGLTNSGAGTYLWGKVGDNNSGHLGLLDTQVGSGAIVSGAEVESPVSSAYGTLTAGSADGPKNLNGSQTVTPGVYTVDATQTLTGTITLSGAGVYIFRSASAYHVANNAQIVLTNGACASNVFWTVYSQMTIGTNAHLEGTIIAETELISLNTGATLTGRAFSLLAQVTLLGNQVTEPICAVPGTGGVTEGTITVVKHVINDSGGTMAVADFPLFINGTKAVSGVTYNYAAPATYNITETSNANYTRTFSGDCNASGQLNLTRGLNEFCIITNNDIGAPAVVPLVPPLIDVVKVPSPLSLPNGPGLVTYTYTLRNIGTVPVTDVTMVGDTCSPITRISGDTNNDSKLDLNETWVYTCATTLQATHTNIVTATGWANGLSATDIASAQVIVGSPIVPPLIHVTKVPSPLALLAGGGTVTYTEKISNPGVVALSNVTLNDDKCSPMKYVSGDINNDSKLGVTETWTYTCESKLTQTTTNTAIASGQANGITVRDIAVATVVVAAAVPALPSTGFAPSISPLNIALLAAFALLLSISLFAVLKKRFN
jgi:uncharacterized repeat protein (TIGR01451 family)